MVIWIVLRCLSAATVLADSFRVSVIAALCLTVSDAVAIVRGPVWGRSAAWGWLV